MPEEVYNPTDEPVHLFKNTTLGILTPMTYIKLETIDTVDASRVNRVQVGKQPTQSLPEEIQKLADDARQTLTQEQGEKFHQLILDYRDIFSTTWTDRHCSA